MDSELSPQARWRVLEKHFQAALNLAPAQRADYLKTELEDEELRSEVQDLLSADAEAKTGFSTLISGEASQMTRSQIGEGSVIGAYRIVAKIAEGGMGAVYRAERADGAFRQDVAIKLLRQQLPSDKAVERFMHERQVLADLEHPGIARLLDGGTTEQGLPYLAMELIEGEPIDVYCQSHQLGLTQRLRLFQQVCAAVQAAHQSLVIHRDIKPSNVLVDATGQAKLLDFGIAKLMQAEGTTQVNETLFGAGAMTPEFASPEQIRGQRITTASDVYSLGVLLYKLLTGVAPYAQWRQSPLDLQNAVCNTEPLRPSLRLAQVQSEQRRASDWKPTFRQIDRDLDEITLKAMRKQPNQRYSSPVALTEDIGRYLQHQPVLAQRASWRYRIGKYLRRNVFAVVSGGLTVFALMALVAFYTWRLTVERDVATQERNIAEEVSDFMVNLISHANPEEQDPTTSVAEILAQGASRLEEELGAQPLVAARLMLSMAQAQQGLGQVEQAIALQRRALQLRQAHLPQADPLIAEAMEVLGAALIQLEIWAESQALLEAALQIRQTRRDDQPVRYARSLLGLVELHQRNQRREPFMLAQAEQALVLLQDQSRPDSKDLARAQFLIAIWHEMNHDYANALHWARQARSLLVNDYGEKDRALLGADEIVGRLLWRVGDCQEAIQAFRRSLNLIGGIKGQRHVDNANTHYFMSRCQMRLGNYAAANENFYFLIAMEEKRQALSSGRYLLRALIAHAHYLIELGHFELAKIRLQRSETLIADGVGHDSAEQAQLDSAYAHWYQAQGETFEAVVHWKNHLDRLHVRDGANVPLILLAELHLASAYLTVGDTEAALSLIAPALSRFAALLGTKHPDYGWGLAIQARAFAVKGEISRALAAYSTTLEILHETRRNDSELSSILQDYQDLLEAQGGSQSVARVQKHIQRLEDIKQRLQLAANGIRDLGYVHWPNAAIEGYNHKVFENTPLKKCMELCSNETDFYCKSLDWQKNLHTCYLHWVSKEEVGGLKSNYIDNRYDHYARLGVDSSADLPPLE
ncbi:MAG: protein kinase domain-containing protein [Oceanococcus sp.]